MSEGESNDLARRLWVAFRRFNKLHWRGHIMSGLRPHEFGLLHAVMDLSAIDPAGPRASDLSERLGVTPPTVTQQVSVLERRGLVERRMDSADRRSVRIRLSSSGAALLEANKAAVYAFFQQIVRGLGQRRSEQFLSLLSEAAECMESSLPPDGES